MGGTLEGDAWKQLHVWLIIKKNKEILIIMPGLFKSKMEQFVPSNIYYNREEKENNSLNDRTEVNAI